MTILGLCGSLRAQSSNGALLKAAMNHLSSHEWLEFDLAKLPYFDSEQQFAEPLPEAVAQVRKLAASCDCIFIATPEYAHGLPGLLKNALEWIFHEGTQRKAVVVVIGSIEGENTRAQLIEILKTMDFEISESQTMLVKGPRTKIDSEGKWLDLHARDEFHRFCSQLDSQ